MSPQELAKVGKDVNKQGQGVDEQSIQAAMDRELTEDRKKQVGKFKARKDAARSKDAQQKAELKSNLVKAVVKSGIKVAGAAAEANADTTKSERISARADKAGERGNLVREAKLRDRAANVKGKEELRAARQSTKRNQNLAAGKARAASPEQQKKLDKYNLKKAYGSDTKRSAYKPGGAMTQRKSPGGLNLTFRQAQDGGIMSSPGGAGKPKSAMDDLIEAQRRYDQGKR
tara:strand:- start:394 stop:1083 length:690 start_codon:yes stop_codon:yes gene_type:complete